MDKKKPFFLNIITKYSAKTQAASLPLGSIKP